MKRRIVTLALVVLAGAAVSVLRPKPSRDAGVRTAGSITAISLDSLGAKGKVHFSSFAGRPLVVNYFATWCVFCIAEMPAFERVHASFGDRVAFVGIALEDTPEGARRLVEKTGVTYTVAQDPDGGSFTRIGGRGMPTTVFIDARGTVVERFTGPLSEDALRSRISRHFGL